MIALPRFFLRLQPGIELRLVAEGRPVNALELRILFVPAIIRSRHTQQLEGFHVAGAHHVRPGAEIDKVAVLVKRDRLPFRNVSQTLHLVFLLSLLEKGPGFVARLDRFLEGLVLLHDFPHLLFDPGKIFRREPVGDVEIIIEAFVRRRTNVQKRLRPESENRRGHNMSAGMASALQLGHPVALIQRLALRRSVVVLHTR